MVLLLKTLSAFVPILSMLIGLLMPKPADDKDLKHYRAAWIAFGAVSFAIILAGQIIADRESQPRVEISYAVTSEYVRSPIEN
jgi:hypothetical protein